MSSSPPEVRTPVTFGTPLAAAGPVTSPVTDRRGESSGSGRRSRPHTRSPGGRRRSDEPLVSLPRRAVFDERRHEREHVESGGAPPRSAWVTSGKAASRGLAPGRVEVVAGLLRNCATPAGCHPCHASSGEPGTSPPSRSRTVTSCPCLASIIAIESPTIPPPMTTILGIRPPPSELTSTVTALTRHGAPRGSRRPGSPNSAFPQILSPASPPTPPGTRPLILRATEPVELTHYRPIVRRPRPRHHDQVMCHRG